MNKSPCKDCNDRAPACHDTCLAYRGWAAALKERQERLQEMNRTKILYGEYAYRRWTKQIRRKK